MSAPQFTPQDLGISDTDWQRTPVSVRAVVRSIDALQKRIAQLEEQLKLNSDNSSQPSSSDRPGHKREKKGKLPSDKPRGAQPGHPGRSRPLKPLDQIDECRVYKPAACGHCGKVLSGEDPKPYRWQVTDIPPMRPITIEYQVHKLSCPVCGQVTRGQLPPEIARSQFGPRVSALVGLLIGQERLSKRQVKRVLRTLFGIDMSVGSVVARQQELSNSLAEAYETVQQHIHTAPNRNIDETPWRQAWQRAWLWSVACDRATLFQVAPRRDQATARALLGEATDKVSTSDRFTAYNGLDAAYHQTCWAHLMRTWRRFQLRDGPSAQVGGMLEIYTDFLLHRWREVTRGHLTRAAFLQEVPQHQHDIRLWLEMGTRVPHTTTAGTCRRLLRDWSILWTFTRYEGVEPTNNRVERALRHGVIWRKLCYGTASEDGSRFVERMLTVVATARQQQRQLMDFLYASLLAYRRGDVAPTLL